MLKVIIVFVFLSKILSAQSYDKIIYPKFNQVVTDSVGVVWNKEIDSSKFFIEFAFDSIYSNSYFIDSTLSSGYTFIPDTSAFFWCRIGTGNTVSSIDWKDLIFFGFCNPSNMDSLKVWYDFGKMNYVLSGDSVSQFVNMVDSLDTVSVSNGVPALLKIEEGLKYLQMDGQNLYSTSVKKHGAENSVLMLYRKRLGYNDLLLSLNVGAKYFPYYQNSSSIFYRSLGSVSFTNFSLDLVSWKRISYLRKGNNLNLYDGEVFKGSKQASFNEFEYNYFGGQSNGNLLFKGDISEILIFSKTLASSEFDLVNKYLLDYHAPPVFLGKNQLKTSFCFDTLRPKWSHYENYLWSDGSSNSSIIVNKTGWYALTVTDVFDRVSVDSIYIEYPSLSNLIDSVICQYDTISYSTNLPKDLYSFNWSNGTVDSSISVFQSEFYSVTVTDSLGCTFESDTFEVKVDSLPSKTIFGGDTSFCKGADFIAKLPNSNYGDLDLMWNSGITTNQLTIDTTGLYILELTDTLNCKTIDSIQVNIRGIAPTVVFSSNDICLGDTMFFVNSSFSNDSSNIVSYKWYFGDGNTSLQQSTNNFYSDSGQHIVSLKIETDSMCFDSVAKDVYVYNTPQVSLFTSIEKGCINTGIDFESVVSGIGIDDSIVGWLWEFGDGNTSLDPNKTNHLYGFGDTIMNYSLQVTSLQGCEGIQNDSIEVLLSDSKPLKFVIIEPAMNQIYPDSNVLIKWNNSNNSIFYQVKILDNQNTFLRDSIVDLNYLSIKLPIGEYKVVIEAYNLCNDVTFSDTVAFECFLPNFITNNTLFLESSSILSDSLISVWEDKSGNVNNAVQLDSNLQPKKYSDSLLLNGIAPVIFDDQNDFLLFSDSIIKPSSVFWLADFGGIGTRVLSATNENNGLLYMASGGFALFKSPKQTILANVTTALNFMNFSFNLNNNHDFALNFQSPVSASFTEDFYFNRIGSSSQKPFGGAFYEIIAYDRVLDSVETSHLNQYLRWKYSPPINLGADIRIGYGFCDTSIVADSRFETYQWIYNQDTLFGDTLNMLSGINKSGVYKCHVTDMFGFESVDSIYVTFVNQNFVAGFRDSVICQYDSLVYLSNLSNSDYSFNWSSGTTDSSISIFTADFYSLTVTDSLGCTFESDTFEVKVDSLPSKTIFGGDTSFCKGADFVAKLPNSNYGDLDLMWNTGITTNQLTIDTTGLYILELTDTLNCKTIDSIQINIRGNSPTADFTSNNVCLNDSMIFTNQSFSNDASSIVSNKWYFGDNQISSNQNVKHLYSDSGSYMVSLRIETDSMCFDSIARLVRTYDLPTSQFQINNTLFCSGDNINFEDFSFDYDGGVSFLQWNFGDSNSVNNTSNLIAPKHNYTNGGNYTITLIATDINGCVDTSNQKLHYLHIDVAPFSLYLNFHLQNSNTSL
jgi:PKD repeat protein